MAIELRSRTARAVVLPQFGGRLHQLYLSRAGREEPVLWSPGDPREYAAEPTHGGSFPMAPWPNRIAGGRFTWRGVDYRVPENGGPNAIHGRALNVPWTVIARTRRVCEMTVAFDHGWPWAGKAWQRIEVSDTGLRMKLEVRAERDAFPAGCGWHPWFRRDAFGAADVRLTMKASQRYVTSADLPTGELVPPAAEFDFATGDVVGNRRVDACYRGLIGTIEIAWGDVRLRMEVSSQGPHVMVYTPPFALCVEPQTCAPDAFNLFDRGITGTGFAVAEPGRPVSIESRWAWDFP